MNATTILLGSSQPQAFQERLATLLPEMRCLASQPWDLAAQALRADAIVVDDATVDETVLRLAPRLRLVQVLGPDLERIDLDACARYGVYVANVPWGRQVGAPGFARLVESGIPGRDLAASTLARIVAGNVRRLERGQAPLFWANPPTWLDPEQALCGRSVTTREQSA
jgi:D-isomer specific 2-hydroxyacid dehydrogenase-like protein